MSSTVAHHIDEEIRAVIDKNYHKAETILQDNISILHKMANALMKWETIDKDQIDALMSGNDPQPPKDIDLNKPSSTTMTKLDKNDTVPPKADKNSINKHKPAGQV